MTFTSEDRTHLGALLSPSWVSGLLAILIGLSLTVGVITAFTLHNSTIQQQILSWQQNQPKSKHALTTPDQTLEENDKPTLQGSWPLIIVWSVIGLITYTVAASIMHSLHELAAVRKSLGYVNANPRSILEAAAERITLRVVAAIIFGLLVWVFFRQVIPYGISASHASAADLISLYGVLYGLLSFSVVTLTVHALAIFLRLTFGKIRLFSDY